ncbi:MULTISPECIES: DUF6126 family protein [Kitasatospora]|uniref:Small hydrophobic protein n=2 Tax=Kitasatospora TaxID=2063 RepID=A0ABT1IPM4_9ACTN|nr:DUF6126 family protein [Kitasatospora paracochleata]MCP2306959.1 hypothetical protein [Kitasatospora paracochleata]
MAEHTTTSHAARPVPQHAPTTDAGHRTDRRVWIRATIYIAATHAFAGFVILLFEIGGRGH